jgi:MFS family permease
MLLLLIAVTAAAYAGVTVSPLQETIQGALALTDNQIALLQGPALALPTAIAAIPLGLLIDRHSRVRLLLIFTLADAITSAFTALAGSFGMLLITRSFIGLTSFAVNPVALSLIADLYPATQRGRANMAMSVGQSAGIAAAFALGGALIEIGSREAHDWRWAMLWLTAPLAAMALFVLLMREPVRTGLVIRNPSMRETGVEIWRYRKLVTPVLIGVLMGQIALGANFIWAAPMLSRSFALPPARVGTIMATALLLSGILGSIVGGVLADYCHRAGGPRRTGLILSVLAVLSVPLGLFALLPGSTSAGALFIAFITVATSISVMGTTLLLIVIPNELRGLCMAVLTAACVLIGNGLAPLIVSMLAEMIGGGAMIGTTLSLVCVATGVLSATSFALGRRYLPGIGDAGSELSCSIAER